MDDRSSARPAAVFVARIARSLLGEARVGVNVRAAIVFVALAAVQGLIVVGALCLLLKAHKISGAAPPRWIRSGTPSAPTGPGSSSAETASTEQRAPTLPTADPASSLAANGAPQKAAPELPLQSTQDLGQDESGLLAPSCQELLRDATVRAGDFPRRASDEVQAANRALVKGNLDASERALCKAVLWDQTNPAILLELAQLMLLRRDGVKAADWAKQGLARDPENARGQGILGDSLARLGQFDQANKAWLSSLHVQTSSIETLKALSLSSLREAQGSLKRRDLARAERFFRRAAVLDSDSLPASNGLSDVLLKLGDRQAALRWANHSVSVAPRNVAARMILGDVLFQRGERDAAEREWREVLELEPENSLAKRRLSRLNRPPAPGK